MEHRQSAEPQERSQPKILVEMNDFDSSTATDGQRLSHNCYFELISRAVGYGEILTKMSTDSEEVELMLERTVLQENSEKITEERSVRFVYEDYFNPVLLEVAKHNLSFENLKNVCHKYDKSNT
ncbi:unnamed protein product [Didymodactylos carnosus]|uniref:Uncharacterized protein n=1 Tax=Didymodactylos carnosus TaxID=1234261 RepID=A0A815HT05_9BILA|nr:unnamed protein product [Didymodactylos carnosus]CAF1356690.1 unnamed protein product [Didymodactylos carnosus]CAF4133750.1 unnamed protein product [Didymodactylos carnosus]CAF4230928.1 unnamed protein product [Didymodactylos carnosus]